MRPRYNQLSADRLRYWQSPNWEKSVPRDAVRYNRPNAGAKRQSDEPSPLKLSETELVSFSLSCIEKLACPSEDDASANQPMELTIAQLVREKLPGYTALKAELEAAVSLYSIERMRTGSSQAAIHQLRARITECENAVAAQLLQTGETIGLPKPLMTKLANLTQTILSRMAV